MWVRAAACGLLGVCALGAAAVAEAGFAAIRAEADIRAVIEGQAKGAAFANLAPVAARAGRALSRSWAAPRLWHAGAMEMEAWRLSVESAARRDPERGERRIAAAAWTARAVTASPIHPAGWMRLAALHDVAPSRPCATSGACLEASFVTAPMGLFTAQSLACQRLDLATRLGVVTRADDPRVGRVMRAQTSMAGAARCISRLPPGEFYGAFRQVGPR